ncbi:MAG TPA: hypothetical protein PLB01_16235 [Thermoanaerobaculia bacterium]|nr:hypothetical protein [Thermoanaerobaculia bacterium]
MALWIAVGVGIFLLATGAFVLATRLVARRKGKIFLEGLGGVVRIGTPCLLASAPLALLRNSESPGGAAGAAPLARGRALIPGTVALTPAGLAWEGLWGRTGSYSFEEIQRLETDERLSSGRGFLRSKVLRVTATSGEVAEFVVSPGHAWEWRQALGEWAANRGRIAGTRI